MEMHDWRSNHTEPCARFGSTYTKIGTIQKRLAWPLRKDDTQIREAFHIKKKKEKRKKKNHTEPYGAHSGLTGFLLKVIGSHWSVLREKQHNQIFIFQL